MDNDKKYFKRKATIYFPGDSNVGTPPEEVTIETNELVDKKDREKTRKEFSEIAGRILGEDPRFLKVTFLDEDKPHVLVMKDYLQRQTKNKKFKEK